jgi:hypothetical protein
MGSARFRAKTRGHIVPAAPPPPTPPQWALSSANRDPLTPGAGDNAALAVDVLSVPAGATGIDYRVDGGSWTSAGGIVDFEIAGLTADVEYDVELRSTNAVGASVASAVQSARPYPKEGGWVRVDDTFIAGWTTTGGNLVSDFSAVRDGKIITDGAMTSGTAILTSDTANFEVGDVDKTIWVNQAGATTTGLEQRLPLATTIASRQSATQVTLATTAQATVTGAVVAYGTNNDTAIGNWVNWIKGGNNRLGYAPGNYTNDGLVYLYSTHKLINPTTAQNRKVGMYGDGANTQFRSVTNSGGTSADANRKSHFLFQNTAPGSIVRDFGMAWPFTTRRAGSAQSGNGRGLFIGGGCNGLTFWNVQTAESASGNNFNSSNNTPNTNIKLYYCFDDGSWADPFHFEGSGQTNCETHFCAGANGQEDIFAFIGRVGQVQQSGFKCNDCNVYGTNHGGGVHVEGWHDGEVKRNNIRDTAGAGLRASCVQATYNSSSVDNVVFEDNLVENCVSPEATASGLAPIMLDTDNPNQALTNIFVTRNTVRGTVSATAGIKGRANSATEPITATLTGNIIETNGSTLTDGITKNANVTFIDGGGNTYDGSPETP